ncbi:recombinase family protein [Mesorhizobium sp. YM1C-6-2]|uniref:recombinase family protein n=1 Tax=Mesorhizobium sp. YM1C-6-2 TaxID=1827501 RepID=UPI000EF1ECEB|nr:recombinase family protein [Mesorhizobium sp. YM1C-6-2]RLP23894.1 recombinase family protein [Mesorhizobium sp. YM1C-6-2]
MLTPRDLKGRRAISYARWSSDRQSAGDSLRRQTEEAERFCLTYGLTLDHQMVDNGVSAFKGANLEASLGRFVEGVKAGTIPSDTVLLVEAMDRVSRVNHMDALEFFHGVLKTGVTIVTMLDQRVHTLEDYRSNVASVLMSIMAMSAANEYSAKLSERVEQSYIGRVERAKDGARVKLSKVPFWIDQKTQELNGRADDARLIFRLASEGVSHHSIVLRLNTLGIPSAKGGPWVKSAVQSVLATPAAYGALRLKGETIPDYFSALITETEWLAIQHRAKVRRSNPQANNAANLFSRLTRCGHCGSAMTMTTSRVSKYRYLACSGRVTKRTDCDAPNWHYETFENAFLDRIGFLAVPSTDAPREDPTASIMDALSALETKRENVLAGMSEATDVATRAILLRQSDELGARIDATKRQLVEARESAARASYTAGTDFTEDAARIKVMSVEDREGARRLIADLVEKIELESDGDVRLASVTLRSGRQQNIVFGNAEPQ